MNILKIAGFALIGLVAVLLLRRMKDEYAHFTALFVCVALTASAVGVLAPVIEYLNNVGEQTSLTGMFSLMFKSCGVAVITTLAASLCKDSGETALAAKVELCGKSMILAMSLPLIKQVFDEALKILE